MRKTTNRKAIWFILCSFLSVWVLALFTGINWETNDDSGIAYLISQTATGGTIFQWKALVWILHQLYGIFPRINHWLLFSIFCISLGFSMIAYSIRYRFDTILSTVISLAILFVIHRYVLYSMNFTKTAAVVLSGGMALLLKSENEDDFSVTETVAGIMAILIGTAVREEVCLLLAPFFLLISCCNLTGNSVHKKRVILLISATIIAVGASKAVNRLLLTDSEKQYIIYNSLRSNITDYGDLYPPFESLEDVYNSLSLNENDQSLLFSWFTEDTEVFTPNVLKAISETRNVSYNLGYLAFKTYWAAFDAIHTEAILAVVIVLLLFIVFLLIKERKKWFIILLCTLLAACEFSVLVWRGRSVNRVTFSILFILLCSFLSLADKNGSTDNAGKYENGFAAPLLLLVSIIVSASVIACGTTQSTPYKTIKAIESREYTLYDLIDKNRDNVFFMFGGLGAKGGIFTEWEAFPRGYCDNMFSLSGWSARCPYNIEKLHEYGIDNPVRALAEKDNTYGMYVWGEDSILEFINRHYGPGIIQKKESPEGMEGNLFIHYERAKVQ